MDPTVDINERVDVVALYRKGNGLAALCFPYKMRYHGREIIFKELGMRHPTTRGKRMVHIFDVSDGTNDYRLEFDAEALTWILIAIIPGGMK